MLEGVVDLLADVVVWADADVVAAGWVTTGLYIVGMTGYIGGGGDEIS